MCLCVFVCHGEEELSVVFEVGAAEFILHSADLSVLATS